MTAPKTLQQCKVRPRSASCKPPEPSGVDDRQPHPEVALELSAFPTLLSVLFIYPTQLLTKASPAQAQAFR